MKYLATIFYATFICGCAAPLAQVKIDNIEASESLNVVDSRPTSEKENKTFSFSTFNEAYGKYRRGDKELTPGPIRLLQHRVYEKFLGDEKSTNLIVKHFVVYLNYESETRKAAEYIESVVLDLVNPDPSEYFIKQKNDVSSLAKVMTKKEFDAIGEEYERAKYTAEENPEKLGVYIVYLEAEINGVSKLVRTMTPVQAPKDQGLNPHAVAAETAISFLLDQY